MADDQRKREPSVRLVGPSDKPKARLASAPALPAASTAKEGRTVTSIANEEPLPILLAGPIVRRVEEQTAWIWIATSVPVWAAATVHRMHNGAPAEKVGYGGSQSKRLGERLHITLVEIAGKAGPDGDAFPTGVVLGYDMTLTLRGQGLSVAGEVLLHTEDIAYSPMQLPTFTVPEGKDALRFVHGSCHKLDGPGGSAMFLLDAALRRAAADAAHRPSALLLTGDQIYGDDVHDLLIEGVIELGHELLCWNEFLPGEHDPIVMIRPGRRGEIVRDRIGFTVGAKAGANHLLGFGEYAAMYLLTWSPEVLSWEAIPRRASEAGAEIREIWQPFDKDKHLAAGARTTRRVLANISTYMILDDHEVTDDWNITRQVFERVERTPGGKRVIANALAAYWAFQSIGNNPAKKHPLEPDICRYLGAGLDKLKDEHTARVLSHDFEEAMWAPAGVGDAKKGFHDGFTTATSPPVLFLDTRTFRSLEERTPPALLRPDELFRVGARITALPVQGGMPVILVSPAPFLGYEPVESLQAAAALIPREKWTQWDIIVVGASRLGFIREEDVPKDPHSMDMEWDPEAWGLHKSCFFAFLDTLARSGKSRFVVLSGDVHYAYIVGAEYTLRDPAAPSGEWRIAICQLTSSAIRNHPTPGKYKALDKGFLNKHEREMVFVHRAGTGALVVSDRPSSKLGGPEDWVCRLVWRFWPLDKRGTCVVSDNNVGVVEVTNDKIVQNLLVDGGKDKHTVVPWQDLLSFVWEP